MPEDYTDVLKHLTKEPLWWDEHGVPRFRTITTVDLAQIQETQCEICHKVFMVKNLKETPPHYADIFGNECTGSRQFAYLLKEEKLRK